MPKELGSILTGVEITEQKALHNNLLLTWLENICFSPARSSIFLGIIFIYTRHRCTTTLFVWICDCVRAYNFG